MTTINFYRAGDAHGYMSNFSRHPITVDGAIYPTSEHYFQAMKFASTDPEWAEEIRTAAKPGEAAKMGKSRSHLLRPDWEEVKDGIMRRAVATKFAQHEDVGRQLVETGDTELIEHTKNDGYWADGGDGSGKNMLGIILMEVRSTLKGDME